MKNVWLNLTQANKTRIWSPECRIFPLPLHQDTNSELLSYCTRTRTATVPGQELPCTRTRTALYQDKNCHCTRTRTATVPGQELPCTRTRTRYYCTRTRTATVPGQELPLYQDKNCPVPGKELPCTRTRTTTVPGQELPCTRTFKQAGTEEGNTSCVQYCGRPSPFISDN